MIKIPTRWRTTFREQLADAKHRLSIAEKRLKEGDGSRALQAAYPAVVAAATVRVWLSEPPWHRPLPAEEMQRRIREAFPSRFGALAALDLRDALTSPWTVEAAEPYVGEARSFVEATEAELERWLAQEST